jgi:hypothetical protein
MRFLPVCILVLASFAVAAEPPNTEVVRTISPKSVSAPVFAGNISIPAENDPYRPIVATYTTDGIPEGASIVPEWSATDGVEWREPVTGTLYIWAPPGRHELRVVLDWIFIDWEAKTFQRGRPELIGTFQVGEAPDIPEPKPKPDPTLPSVTRVTYVYEKDQTQIPPQVAAALMELNKRGIQATEYEDDNKTGAGTVPEQYKTALAKAKEKGLPALVAESPAGVVVVHDPRTSSDVFDAVKVEGKP